MIKELGFYINPNNENRRIVLNSLAECGVKYIGIDGTDWNPETQISEINEFKNELVDFDLTLMSMHSSNSIIADANIGAPLDLYEAQTKELRRFGMLGGKSAVYHACFMRDISPDNIDRHINEIGQEKFQENYIYSLKNLAREASKYDIAIVLENVWHSVHSGSVKSFLPIIESADEPNIGICLDSGHAHLAERIVADEIRTAGPLLKDTHFHDNIGKINGIFLDQHLPPGLGTIDWQNACVALNDIQYHEPIIFEGIFGAGDNLEKGYFGGELSHRDLINMTINNWRNFEIIAETKFMKQ